ncbi:MAG: LAGLIDADG family homing endonuclease [Candidatus Omnitrophota bacterium]
MSNKRKDLKIEGANLWYLVGLITSDGCLCKDKRHVDVTSKDKDFLQGIREQLGLISKVCVKNKGTLKQAYRIQIANKGFYDFLLSVGLVQNKSLILGTLNVPRQFFIDFLRGMIDGDGCIRRWIHPSNGREQWSLRIYSGSKEFIEWLKETTEALLKIRGKLYKQSNSQWVLKYGKMAAKEITRTYPDIDRREGGAFTRAEARSEDDGVVTALLRGRTTQPQAEEMTSLPTSNIRIGSKQCYYRDCLGLDRKIKLAQECYSSFVGWQQSKTVFN